MKRLLWFALLMVWFIPIQAMAQSPFDGTWKLDPNTAQTQAKPEKYLLKDGRYDCSTCDPPLHVRADGNDQKITGDPCSDTVSVKTIDDRTVEETYKKNGAIIETSKMNVSSDGNKATVDWSGRCDPRGELMTIQYIMTRVAPGPPGAHVVSGSWRLTKRVKGSDNVFTATLKLEGDTFSFSDPVGYGYTAKLDGTETPMKGSLGNEIVSVRRLAENTIEETLKENRKVTEIVTYTLSADGKSMIITIEHPTRGTSSKYTAEKQ